MGDSALICPWTAATAHLIYGLTKLQLLTRDQGLHTNLLLGELNALVGVCVSGALKTTHPTPQYTWLGMVMKSSWLYWQWYRYFTDTCKPVSFYSPLEIMDSAFFYTQSWTITRWGHCFMSPFQIIKNTYIELPSAVKHESPCSSWKYFWRV